MTVQLRGLFIVAFTLYATVGMAQPPTQIGALDEAVTVLRDAEGIPHILARNEHDLILMQGWVHARDRLFQMDTLRRQASGTLAELLGPDVLESDVELRTLGLRRAAERSMDALSPEALAALEAYAEGVNAFVGSHPLPPEYAALELTSFEPWTALDSVAIGKLLAFGLSFDLDDIDRTITLMAYQQAGEAFGFDGTALFFEDTHRVAPFDSAATIPNADPSVEAAAGSVPMAEPRPRATGPSAPQIPSEVLTLGRRYLDKVRRLPYLRDVVRRPEDARGSNEWAISGLLTETGHPLMANDPHLDLGTPSTFYQNHLHAPDAGFDVIGSSFAGVPYVILGHNRDITWGATVHPMDVTDVFQEQLVPDPSSPSGLSTVHDDVPAPEPVIRLPQEFKTNIFGDGKSDIKSDLSQDVLIVPRRDNGPIIELDPATGMALSVQYTGFSPTREVDAFRAFNLARNLDDFTAGLQFFDFGSENWAYADTAGNIAYFTSAEMPVREDLQAGVVTGLPPFFIRDGISGANEWLPVQDPPPNQAVPHEILPFEEMPKIVNPPAGYFVNANNDPDGRTLDNDPLNQLRPGGGIAYLGPGFDIGIRAGRITQLIEEKLADAQFLSADDMAAIQADVVLGDAEVFRPVILQAFDNATRDDAHDQLADLATDLRIMKAVNRLETWDLSTPTGVEEGYDASDPDGRRLVPIPTAEIDNSVAATIYAVWRASMLANTIDGVLGGLPKPGDRRAVSALRHLLDNFDANDGFGASGLNFFNVPGVSDPADRRDIIVLQSLSQALDELAGDKFADAFDGSSDQNKYRWGRLHRIVLAHPLGAPFSIPPAGDFEDLSEDLPGLAVDGGFEVVDASRHSARADSDEAFTFDSGPTRRFVAEVQAAPPGIAARSSLPGGESGDLGSPFYTNLLGRWLTNDTYPLRQKLSEFVSRPLERDHFVPGPGNPPPTGAD